MKRNKKLAKLWGALKDQLGDLPALSLGNCPTAVKHGDQVFCKILSSQYNYF